MDYRAGKCSQCGAEYQIPASFAHNVARCKQCGGVVHLDPRASARPAGSAGTPESPGRGPRAEGARGGSAPEQRASRPRESPESTDAGRRSLPTEPSPRPNRSVRPSTSAPRPGVGESPTALAGGVPESGRRRSSRLLMLIGLGLIAIIALWALRSLFARGGAQPAYGPGTDSDRPAAEEPGSRSSPSDSADPPGPVGG